MLMSSLFIAGCLFAADVPDQSQSVQLERFRAGGFRDSEKSEFRRVAGLGSEYEGFHAAGFHRVFSNVNHDEHQPREFRFFIRRFGGNEQDGTKEPAFDFLAHVPEVVVGDATQLTGTGSTVAPNLPYVNLSRVCETQQHQERNMSRMSFLRTLVSSDGRCSFGFVPAGGGATCLTTTSSHSTMPAGQ